MGSLAKRQLNLDVSVGSSPGLGNFRPARRQVKRSTGGSRHGTRGSKKTRVSHVAFPGAHAQIKLARLLLTPLCTKNKLLESESPIVLVPKVADSPADNFTKRVEWMTSWRMNRRKKSNGLGFTIPFFQPILSPAFPSFLSGNHPLLESQLCHIRCECIRRNRTGIQSSNLQLL